MASETMLVDRQYVPVEVVAAAVEAAGRSVSGHTAGNVGLVIGRVAKDILKELFTSSRAATEKQPYLH